jgi:hypothetical protein
MTDLLKDPQVISVAAQKIHVNMDSAVELLQRARHHSMVSAARNGSQAGRDAYDAITLAIEKAAVVGTQSGRCHLSSYTLD